MTTPEISKYVVHAAITNNTTGTFTEIFNTTGVAITAARGTGTIVLTAASAIFLDNKTLIIDGAKATAGVQLTVTSITTTVITLAYTQANPDEMILEVQIFNLDGIN